MLENVRLLLDLIEDEDDRTDVAGHVCEVLVSHGFTEYAFSLAEEVGSEDIYASLALACARAGDLDGMHRALDRVSDQRRMEVLAEIAMEGKLDKAELAKIVGEYLRTVKSVDLDDEDVCYNMAVLLASVGDYTRARGFANNFCSLIVSRESLMVDELFRMLDGVRCAGLKMIVGDREEGARFLRKSLGDLEKLDDARRFTVVFDACETLSKHGLFSQALELLGRLEDNSRRGVCLCVILENALRSGSWDDVKAILDKAKRIVDMTPENMLRVGIILRKYGVDEWEQYLEKVPPESLEGMDLRFLLDIMEDLVDSGYFDVLERICRVPIYWEDLRRSPELLLRYAYILYATGRISGGAKIFDDYVSDIVVTKERKMDPAFPAYYAKAYIVASRKYPEELAEANFDSRLNERLKAISKEILLPPTVVGILDEISDIRRRVVAIESIAEEILVESRGAVADKIITLIPERERIDDVISRVAKRLAVEGEVRDAITLIDLIEDSEKRLDTALAITHRCALKLCKELPSLLKIVIRARATAKKKDVGPVEESKIRVDLAIVFKFAGKRKDYEISLREAERLLNTIRPSGPGDIAAYRSLADGYGYLAAALYVLGDGRSDETLKRAMDYVMKLPEALRMRSLVRLVTWLLFAGWFSAVFEILQIEGLEAALPMVRRALIEAYVRNEMYDEALSTAMSMAMSPMDEVDTLIHYAKAISKTSAKGRALDLLENALKKCEEMEDVSLRLRYMIRIAEVYARVGVIDKARSLADALRKEIASMGNGERDEYLAMLATVYFLIESIGGRTTS